MVENIITGVIVGIITIIGNIFYFKFQFKRKQSYRLLNKQLTDLLLPLYFTFQKVRAESLEWANLDTYDYQEDVVSTPKLLKKEIVPILEKNLYLAEEDLHKKCIEFLEWASHFDEKEEFQKSFIEGFSHTKYIEEFERVIKSEYFNIKKRYLKN